MIPANRINPVGAKLASYLPHAGLRRSTTAQSELQHDRPAAEQGVSVHARRSITTSTTSVALSGFFLRQVTHEANSNYNPVNKFVGGSYQLDRVINTFVLNNTYVLNTSTVLTLRGGYNEFDDNYNLPTAIRRDQRVWLGQPVADEPDVRHEPVPDDDHHRLQGHRAGPTGRPTATTSTASTARSASWPVRTTSRSGGDYRVLGAKSLNYGASTGTYTFTGTLQRQRAGGPAARLPAERQHAAQHAARRLREATTAATRRTTGA